jgi:hypothetical protein
VQIVFFAGIISLAERMVRKLKPVKTSELLLRLLMISISLGQSEPTAYHVGCVQVTLFHWVPVLWLIMVDSSVSIFTTYLPTTH